MPSFIVFLARGLWGFWHTGTFQVVLSFQAFSAKWGVSPGILRAVGGTEKDFLLDRDPRDGLPEVLDTAAMLRVYFSDGVSGSYGRAHLVPVERFQFLYPGQEIKFFPPRMWVWVSHDEWKAVLKG